MGFQSQSSCECITYFKANYFRHQSDTKEVLVNSSLNSNKSFILVNPLLVDLLGIQKTFGAHVPNLHTDLGIGV